MCVLVCAKEREREKTECPSAEENMLTTFYVDAAFCERKKKRKCTEIWKMQRREGNTNEKKRKRKYSVVIEFLMQPVLLFIESKISKSKYSMKSIKSVIKNFF